jgi:valyl-tRNA synthetase
MPEIPKSFESKNSEQKWYDTWLERGYFKPEVNPEGEPYSIVIPPPNVTGSLHMGHALNATLQDILTRWKRMSGARALWLPGTDHAGIATQNVVERELAKGGLDRHALGREEFIKRVWQWKAEYGGRIIHQLKKIGASCDWSRERFTLDEGLSKAVRTVFVKLYEEGLIYRSTRLINWCPRCHTALSDLEVEHDELDGFLTYINYPLAEGEGAVTVATTRPETMLGDTAVAVNPEDQRYKDLIGKKVRLPLTGRDIPVIADSAVDPAFGTGAVKVTPAHDFNDEAIAKRHGLPGITVIGDEGHMTKEAGAKYAGMDRYEARKQVLKDLKAHGLIEKEEKHRHSVGHCYRCKTIIEPFSTPQWYVKVEPLAKEAMRAVREKKIKIIPEGWENSYFAWMENIRDWCISRQIWWGHRVPVWYCKNCGEAIVAMEAPAICKCGGTELEQDPDVLDTWFSSALWPFSTLGWPEKTEDLKAFYPTSVLVTAFDILFFWVARMIMMGMKFMGDVPFRDVYIHAIVRDGEGQKMSKSKGNVIDPLLLIDKYGADAFRFTLAAFAAQGRDIKFSEERVVGYRHFINKLWNATRYILMNTKELKTPLKVKIEKKKKVPEAFPHLTVDGDLPSRWILSRLAGAGDEMDRAFSEYRFDDAARRIYEFIWREFCDWYIEMSKVGLQEPEHAEGVRICLLYTLKETLKLLHPFMPFITEELWQVLPDELRENESIMISPFPSGLPRDSEAEREAGHVMEAVTGLRNIRGELNIQPSAKIKALINAEEEHIKSTLENNSAYIKRLTGAEELKIAVGLERPLKSAVSVRSGLETYVPIEGLVDINSEIERLEKELKKAGEELALCERKLGNAEFVKKAPVQVVEKEKAKCTELTEKSKTLKLSIDRFKEMGF